MWLYTRLLLVFCATAVACSPSADYSGTEFSCAGGETCPPGFSCENTVCVTAGDSGGGAATPGDSDASGGVGASGDIDAGSDQPTDGPPCGAPMTDVQDDFDDGVIASIWSGGYELGGARVSESGGRLSVDMSGGGEAALATTCEYDMTGRQVVMEVVSAGDDDGVEAFVRLQASDDAYAEISADERTLRIEMTGPGSTSRQTENFDAVAHRWWRVRDLGESFEFSTSPDGTAWQVVGGHELVFSQQAVRLSFGARALGTLTSPVPIAMDNLNVP